MFNSVALNVVISLVFIYLLYSLLATIIQELIATHFGLRARILKRAIKRMLDDDEQNPQFSSSFYNHPLIKYLAEGNIHSKPSYLSAQNFSKVVIDLLRGENVQPGQDFRSFIQTALDNKQTQWGTKIHINPETLLYLQSIWTDAQGDVDKFKEKLEHWFDDTMERASGWYKKRTQLILFCIGLGLAILFNIDTISITQKLSHDPKLAEQLATNAATYMQTHEELGQQLREKKANQQNTNSNEDKTINFGKDSSSVYWQNRQDDSIANYIVVESNKLIDSANALIKTDIANTNQLLGLGWQCKCKCAKANPEKLCISDNLHWWSLLGWLISALAISLGAPFWYDLLSKIVKIKGTGSNGDGNNSSNNSNGSNKITPKG